jgi:ATP-binding cassette, subfamily C (CFTR/MRP), member 1
MPNIFGHSVELYILALSLYILSLATYIGTLNASRKLHQSVMSRILKGPMSFFDTTPSGQILSRLSYDVDICDLTFPQLVKSWPIQFFKVRE